MPGVVYFVHGGDAVTVYVDLLFGVNTLINYLLLRGSAAMGGCPAGFWRLMGAAGLGGLYAVAGVLPGLELLQDTVFQLVCAAGMILLAFGWKRNALKQGLFFFALSFAFGGAVLLVVQAVEPDCLFLGGRAYYAVSTPALLLLAGTCYGLAAVVLNGWGTHTGGDLVSLELQLGDRKTGLKALRDTGNTLRDPITGQRILVANWQVLERLLPEAALIRDPAELLVQVPELRFRLVRYEAVGSRGLLPAVKCQVRQGKRKNGVLVAFTKTELSAHGRFEALTGGDIR